MFLNAAAIDVKHIPYKGSTPAMTDLIGGQTELGFMASTNALPLWTSSSRCLQASGMGVCKAKTTAWCTTCCWDSFRSLLRCELRCTHSFGVQLPNKQTDSHHAQSRPCRATPTALITFMVHFV